MSISTIYSDLTKDLENYLSDKLPDISASTAMEIGAYISHRVSIAVSDLWLEQVRLDKLEIRRASRRNKTNAQTTNKSCDTCGHREYSMPQCRECGPHNDYLYWSRT